MWYHHFCPAAHFQNIFRLYVSNQSTACLQPTNVGLKGSDHYKRTKFWFSHQLLSKSWSDSWRWKHGLYMCSAFFNLLTHHISHWAIEGEKHTDTWVCRKPSGLILVKDTMACELLGTGMERSSTTEQTWPPCPFPSLACLHTNSNKMKELIWFQSNLS